MTLDSQRKVIQMKLGAASKNENQLNTMMAHSVSQANITPNKVFDNVDLPFNNEKPKKTDKS